MVLVNPTFIACFVGGNPILTHCSKRYKSADWGPTACWPCFTFKPILNLLIDGFKSNFIFKPCSNVPLVQCKKLGKHLNAQCSVLSGPPCISDRGREREREDTKSHRNWWTVKTTPSQKHTCQNHTMSKAHYCLKFGAQDWPRITETHPRPKSQCRRCTPRRRRRWSRRRQPRSPGL